MARLEWRTLSGQKQPGKCMILTLQRRSLIAGLAFAMGLALLSHWPFPESDPLLQLVLWYKPLLWRAIKDVYVVMCFTTPYIVLSVLASLGLAIGHAGRTWGMDAWLSQRFPSSWW